MKRGVGITSTHEYLVIMNTTYKSALHFSRAICVLIRLAILKRHQLFFRLFSPLQYLHKIIINNIKEFSGDLFIWIAIISVNIESSLIHSMNLTYLFDCKQIYIDTRFEMHSNGNILKITGVCFKVENLMTIQSFFNI